MSADSGQSKRGTMKRPVNPVITDVLVTLALGVAGFFITLIGTNVLGLVLFWWHPVYMRDQGIETALFFSSMLLAPLGALYGVVSGILVSVAHRRWPSKRHRIWMSLGLGYVALLTATVLVIGFIC